MKLFKQLIILFALLAAFSCGDKSANVVKELTAENVVTKNINNCVITEAKIGLGENIAMISFRNGDNPFFFPAEGVRLGVQKP